MDIQLNWTNPNTGEDGTRIYRSTSPMDPQNLPSPLATVGPGANSYTDDTVERYQTYYYRFEAFKGDDSSLSGEKKIAAMPYTGPGPQTLIAGDMRAGYFGTVQGGRDIFRASEFKEAAGITFGEGHWSNEYIRWWKFAWKNEILFIPFAPFCDYVSWQDIYQAGLVYGTDDNGVAPYGTPTNQYMEVTYGNDTFVPRLMTGSVDTPEDSEWDQLVARVHDYVGQYQIGENWDYYTDRGSKESATHIPGEVWCQEVGDDADDRLMRGGNSYDDYRYLDYYNTSARGNYDNNSDCYMPVLVLKQQ